VLWGGAAKRNSRLVAALRVFCFLCKKKKTAERRREEREEKEEVKKEKGKICKYGNFQKNKIKDNL
jgi:hypothetical protein